MKKLIIASIAAVVGFAVNAATVDWQYKITSAQGTEGYNTGYTVYLVSAAAWDAATISEATFSDTSVVLDSTTFGAASGRNAGQKTYTTVISGTTTGARSVSVDSLNEGSTLGVYYVILNTAADPNTYLVANSDTLTGRSDTGEAILGTHTSMTASAAASGTWTAVPEPTSGLRLVLGMAGLALRRRRA